MKKYIPVLLLLLVSVLVMFTACGTQTPDAPAVPSILSCYASSDTAVKVTWTPVDAADGYELWRAESPDAPEEDWFRAKSITDAGEDSYTNGELTAGQTYYYKIRSYVLDKNEERICSGFSDIAYTPAVVLFDEPVVSAADEIRLYWQQVAGAHGYQIWRQNGSGEDSWEVIKTIGDSETAAAESSGDITLYTNTGLTPGQTYTYKMRAFAIAADGSTVFGAYSSPCSVTLASEIPLLTITSPEAASAYLRWTTVPGATGYQIWMSDAWDGTYTIAKTITGAQNAYTKHELTSGATYYFKIRSSTESDSETIFGEYSDVVTVTVQ